jgi:hypothetical protein
VNDDALLAIADLDARLAALARAVSAPDGPADETATDAADAQPVPGGPPADRPARDAARLIEWSQRLGRLLSDLSALRAEVDDAAARLLAASRTPAGPPPAAGAATDPAGPDGLGPAGNPIGFDHLLTGHVTIDAGPFADITGVANFKRALQRVPAAHAVALTTFAADRARFTIDLAEPVALGHAIRTVVPFNFELSETGPRTVALNLTTNGAGAHRFGPPA